MTAVLATTLTGVSLPATGHGRHAMRTTDRRDARLPHAEHRS